MNDSFQAAEERSRAVEERLAEHPEQFRMLTGDRPTGALHIGHYFGSIANRLRLQESGADTWVIVADYQVITDREISGDHPRQRARPAAGLPRLGHRPGPLDDLHPLGGAGAEPAAAAVPELGQRGRAAAQPDREGRGGERRDHVHQRADAHLPGAPGGRHLVLQGQHRPGGQGPAPAHRADPGGGPALQRQVRRDLPRAGRAALLRHQRARARRHQDEQVARQRRRAADERRRDRPGWSRRPRPTATG